MLRGGVCVEAVAGSLQKVSPRIRVLQDRLLDSLPANGAWECLSPAQREAIISLHRARLTRNLIPITDVDKFEGENDREPRKTGKKIKRGQKNYSRPRLLEDKPESETDDSGVRIPSAGTNSSSTTISHNSHEEDSSDPGVRRNSNLFAKSTSANRLSSQKDRKLELNKQTGIANGVGNANKIISKQLNRPGHPQSSGPWLPAKSDITGENKQKGYCIFEKSLDSRRKLERNNLRYKKNEIGRQAISRKNILQRYQTPLANCPKGSEICVSSSNFDSEDHSNTDRDRDRLSSRNNRIGTNKANYDIHERPLMDDEELGSPSSLPITPSIYDSSSTNIIGSSNICSNQSSRVVNYRKSSLSQDIVSNKVNSTSIGNDLKCKTLDKASHKLDYRNQLNTEWATKYNSNWNSIILNGNLQLKIPNISSAKVLPRNHHPAKGLMQGGSVGNLLYEQEHNRATSRVMKDNLTSGRMLNYQKSTAKKNFRSKSLDRTYLEDSSEDESDFEIRRRTERLRRYGRGNHDQPEGRRGVAQRIVDESCIDRGLHSPQRKSKSAWDVSTMEPTTEFTQEKDSKFFRSRKNILSRWKSEEADLVLNSNEKEDAFVCDRNQISSKEKRRLGRSYDFGLDNSTYVAEEDEVAFSRRHLKWQRRSCDFTLDSDSTNLRSKRCSWGQFLDSEMEIMNERRRTSPKEELRRMYRPSIPTSTTISTPESPVLDRRHPLTTSAIIEPRMEPIEKVMDPYTHGGVAAMQPGKYQIRPEITGRKWPRQEDHHSTLPSRPAAVDRRARGNGKNAKSSLLDFRNKFRIFKSLLSF